MDDQSKRESWRSSVSTQLLNLALKKGAICGGSGAFILFVSAIFLPISFLKILGIPIFAIGMFFIAIGWLPYRTLTRLQLKPHEIHLEASSLLFLQQGKPLFRIEFRSIEKMAYLKNETDYGIGLWLKRPTEQKIKVLRPRFNFDAFANWSYQRQGCDLFFSYFSERALEEINECLKSGLDEVVHLDNADNFLLFTEDR